MRSVKQGSMSAKERHAEFKMREKPLERPKDIESY
jgi:hypothetical protein